jgi:hypothetical protein
MDGAARPEDCPCTAITARLTTLLPSTAIGLHEKSGWNGQHEVVGKAKDFLYITRFFLQHSPHHLKSLTIPDNHSVPVINDV